MDNVPTVDLKLVEVRHYPCYLDDSTVEVHIAKKRDGYFMDYYAISHQDPFFCFVRKDREELEDLINKSLEFYSEYRALERNVKG